MKKELVGHQRLMSDEAMRRSYAFSQVLQTDRCSSIVSALAFTISCTAPQAETSGQLDLATLTIDGRPSGKITPKSANVASLARIANTPQSRWTAFEATSHDNRRLYSDHIANVKLNMHAMEGRLCVSLAQSSRVGDGIPQALVGLREHPRQQLCGVTRIAIRTQHRATNTVANLHISVDGVPQTLTGEQLARSLGATEDPSGPAQWPLHQVVARFAPAQRVARVTVRTRSGPNATIDPVAPTRDDESRVLKYNRRGQFRFRHRVGDTLVHDLRDVTEVEIRSKKPTE